MNHSDIFHHLQGISQNSSMNQRLPIASKLNNSSQETEALSQGSSSASNMTSLQHKCPQTMTTLPWNFPFNGNLLIFTERPFATSPSFPMKQIQCGTSKLAQSSPLIHSQKPSVQLDTQLIPHIECPVFLLPAVKRKAISQLQKPW